MIVSEQLSAFSSRLTAWQELAGGFSERRATGASNTPFPVKGGLRLGIWNIENTDFIGLRKVGKSLVAVSPITLPPGDFTICTAIVFRGLVIDEISRRRDEIRVELDKRPNNVAFFLQSNGAILTPLTDLTEINEVDITAPEIGHPIPVSAACYADVQRNGVLCPLAMAYVEFISKLLWPVPFVRLGECGDFV
jgi:hypothetical protein